MPGSSRRIEDYYVRYLGGPDRDWEECRRYGFVSGAGELVRSNMRLLEPGDRVWVYAPKYGDRRGPHGYVGVGIVNAAAVPLVEFNVSVENSEAKRLADLPTKIAKRAIHALTPRKTEHVVGVSWEKTVPLSDAVYGKGFFTNQNVVSRPRAARWSHTLDVLRPAFGVD